MSQHIYAIIPYKSKIYTDFIMDGEPGIWNPLIPELKGIESEFVEPDGLTLFKDFLKINTCLRQSAFTQKKMVTSSLGPKYALLPKHWEPMKYGM